MGSPIIFTVQDGVDPSIAQSVSAIGAAARQSDASIQALTQALQAVSNSGVQALAAQLSATSTATTRLSNTTAKMGAAALAAAQQIDLLVTSYNKLNTVILAATTTITAFGAAAKAASAGAATFNTATGALGRGTGQTTGNFIAASAALNGLELKFGSNTRAAGRFLTQTLGLGPALQAAFPVFGAIALIGVLDIAIDHIDKIALHLHNLTVQAQDDAIALLNSQQKLLKGEKGIGNFLGNKFLGRDQAPDQKINDPSIIIRELNYQTQINDLVAQRNEFGKTGLALQQAKVQAVQDEIVATLNAINTIQAERNKIENKQGTGLLNQKTVGLGMGPGGIPTGVVQSKIPVDSDQFKELTAVAKDYDAELDRLNKQLNILGNFKLPKEELGEPLAAAKDEAKAARAQLKQFTDDLVQLKTHQDIFGSGAKTDSALEQQLALFNEQLAGALPQNVDLLHAKIEAVNNVLAAHKNALEAVTEKYQDQVNNIGLYSDNLKIANDLDKATISLKKQGVELTAQQTASLKELIRQSVSQIQYQSELKKIYEEFNSPLKDYQAKLEAITKLEKDGVITHNQALIALNESKKAYIDTINPLNEYVHGLQDEINLLGKFGIEATVAAEIQKVQNDLRNKGRSLTQNEIQQLSQFLTLLEREKELQTAVNTLYQQNAGAVEKLVIQVTALNLARQKGIVTEQQYDVQLAKLKVDLANLNIEMGKFTKSDVLTSVFGNFIKDFQGLSVGIVKTWQQAFDTIANGAADALGRAIAYGEDLGKALQDVARQALSELISGFIKLGIQMLVSSIISKTASNAAVTASVAQAGVVGAAWAAPAALASLATLGANAAPADTALVTTVALANMLSFLKFNTGGIVPGYGNKDTVPALLTPGEGVLNQLATRFVGASTIQAWNKGQFGAPVTGAASSASARQALVLNLIHDKNAVDVVQINESTIRIMAKQEAQGVVRQETPGLVAGHIANPNSPISKSLKSNTTVRGKH